MIRMLRFNSELETLEKLFFLLVSHLQPWKNGNEDATALQGSDQDQQGHVR